jgi:hypothetical protein
MRTIVEIQIAEVVQRGSKNAVAAAEVRLRCRTTVSCRIRVASPQFTGELTVHPSALDSLRKLL